MTSTTPFYICTERATDITVAPLEADPVVPSNHPRNTVRLTVVDDGDVTVTFLTPSEARHIAGALMYAARKVAGE